MVPYLIDLKTRGVEGTGIFNNSEYKFMQTEAAKLFSRPQMSCFMYTEPGVCENRKMIERQLRIAEERRIKAELVERSAVLRPQELLTGVCEKRRELRRSANGMR